MPKKKVIILTEGGSDFGYGHLVRCKALGDALKEKGCEVHYLLNGDDTVYSVMDDDDLNLVNWHRDSAFLNDYCKDADLCIIDSYHTDGATYNKLARITDTLVVFDDTNRLIYPEGCILINGILNADKLDYSNQKNVRLLLGITFQCVRKEFISTTNNTVCDHVNRIFLSVGGNDLRNLLPMMIEISRKAFPDCHQDIVIGKPEPYLTELLIKKEDNLALLTLHVNAKVGEIARLMREVDLSLTAAGQTLCELAVCGVPGISVSVIDNQLTHAMSWENAGCFAFAGSWNDSGLEKVLLEKLLVLRDKQNRQRQINKMKTLMDGRGAQRIADILLKN